MIHAHCTRSTWSKYFHWWLWTLGKSLAMLWTCIKQKLAQLICSKEGRLTLPKQGKSLGHGTGWVSFHSWQCWPVSQQKSLSANAVPNIIPLQGPSPMECFGLPSHFPKFTGSTSQEPWPDKIWFFLRKMEYVTKSNISGKRFLHTAWKM